MTSNSFLVGDRVRAPGSDGEGRLGTVDEVTNNQLVWVRWDEPVVQTTTSTRGGFFPDMLQRIEASPRTVVVQYWTEYERGWGNRPDGFTLHLSESDRAKFVQDYLKKTRTLAYAPDEYSAPESYTLEDVSAQLYDIVKSYSDNGTTYWAWQRTLEQLEQAVASGKVKGIE